MYVRPHRGPLEILLTPIIWVVMQVLKLRDRLKERK